MNDRFPIQRSSGVAPGRSSGSAFGGLAWAVATSDDKQLDLKGQIAATFAKIERVLADLNTDKRYLLSANILLADLNDKKVFDAQWRAWVGDDMDHWPQRACTGATLSPGTLVEMTVVAARPAPDTSYLRNRFSLAFLASMPWRRKISSTERISL